MNWIKIRYNKRTAKKYGWHPSWLGPGLKEFNSELIEAIEAFQKEYDLEVDGKVGPMTFRRLVASRELELPENFILADGVRLPIDCDVKIDMLPKNCYKTYKPMRKPTMIVTHWDATTSAATCKRILQRRGISTHFCIDNDGVIYQYVDTNNVGWHAGKRAVNKASIGIDFSNAYYMKYDKWYVKKGFGARPICENSKVHGVRLKPHLGYYPIQIQSYKKLVKVLTDHYKIELDTPKYDGVVSEAAKGKFKGIVSHYHLTRGKIDCAGLNIRAIIDSLD